MDHHAQRQTVDARLAALAQYDILDTPAEPGFDGIVLLARRICAAPVALVSLLDAERQWFKAKSGFEASETPLEQSVCAHALAQTGLLVIPDLMQDARTCANTLVTGAPFIRFYAGAVLQTPDGTAIGTLCVLDTVAHPGGLTAEQAESLQALAGQVMTQMELRRAIAQRDAALVHAAEAAAAFRAHQQLLSSELSHRLKNILAMVQAIVAQTLRTTSSVEEAQAALTNRILALGRAQEILFSGTATHAGLGEIVRETVQLYQDTQEQRFAVDGPRIDLGSKAALALALILHELATNATKHGALSAPAGGVTVSWEIAAEPAGDQLVLSWREHDGPPVFPPARLGFGMRLIRGAMAGGSAQVDYPPEGLTFRLRAPMAMLQAG